ncbi:hypothetical protein [Clostridium neonatale]|uniref:hypothetical protein n=1 Tax=Clostridium neonatale TaxID=137838 RepID=UPI0031403117
MLISSSILVSIFTALIFIFKLKDKLSLYPYVSVNSFNIWSMLGENWTSIYKTFI